MNKEKRHREPGKRRQAALALAAVWAAAALAGCTSRNVDNRPPVPAGEGPLGAYAETLVCGMGRSTIANPKFPEGDSYEDNAYTRYLKDVLNVQVVDDFEANGADYDRQVSLSIAAGELPDVMRVGSRDLLDELVENDLVAALRQTRTGTGALPSRSWRRLPGPFWSRTRTTAAIRWAWPLPLISPPMITEAAAIP